MPEVTASSKLSSLNDLEIVEQACSTENNKLFFEEIYNRFYNKVFFKSLHILKSSEDAKDVVHDIFVKIFNNLESFKGEAQFSSWIFAITYNTCATFLRKNKRFLSDENFANTGYDEIDDNQESKSFEIKIQHLTKLLNTLKDEERLILFMYYYDEFTVKEISKYIQLNESAIKMRLKRTRDKLKQMIDETSIMN